jgi:hypothetical protein
MSIVQGVSGRDEKLANLRMRCDIAALVLILLRLLDVTIALCSLTDIFQSQACVFESAHFRDGIVKVG